MIINGNLNLYDSSIESLGKIKQVNGNLILRRSKITFLPNKLEIEGWLDMRFTNIFEFPDIFKIKGEIYLNGSKITRQYVKENFYELLLKCVW